MSTPKIHRKHIKEEKRIVKLLYKKGLLKDYKLNNLYWASYKWFGKKTYKWGKHRFPVFLPEIYFCTTDYWGECDEHALIDHIIEGLIWEKVPEIEKMKEMSDVFSLSTFKAISRTDFIQYLSALPTVVFDSKINKILKYNEN